jgi:hypothetical protein
MISITEVLADPEGAEPVQEFVEIANYGDEPVDLSGWMIDDNGDHNGDLLPEGTVLQAGEAALIVQSGFVSPVENLHLINIESSIGSNGLKNSESESVELYDLSGAAVSVFSSRLTPRQECSIVRRHVAYPDAAGAFDYEQSEKTTPGAI